MSRSGGDAAGGICRCWIRWVGDPNAICSSISIGSTAALVDADDVCSSSLAIPRWLDLNGDEFDGAVSEVGEASAAAAAGGDAAAPSAVATDGDARVGVMVLYVSN